jgi:hypothetical protein
VPLFRVTRKDNPSERFEEDFDDVFAAGGFWAFGRASAGAAPVGAGDVVGNWATSAWIVEIQEHGDAWREVDPNTSRAMD